MSGSSVPTEGSPAWIAGAARLAFVALTGLLAGRQLLIGEPAEGLLTAAATAVFLIMWLRRWPWPESRSVLVGLSLAFAVWSWLFVALCSTRGPDGRQYFVLFDDAFISLRYARNLAHGEGLVWNPGERVEGYTNLLTTLLMAIPSRFFDRSRAALAMQVFGAMTMLGAGFLGFRLARRLGTGAPSAVFAAVLTCYPLAYWTLLGMETGLLSLLLVAGALVVIDRPALAPEPRVSLLLGLAAATRPDAIVPALLLLAARASWATRRRAVAWEATAFALVPLALAAFRWLYYGSLLPNTYMMKMHGLPLGYRLREGIGTALPYLAWLTPAIVLALLSLRGNRDGRRVVLFALWAASVAVHVYVGGDAWPRWRFLCPSLPLLFILTADGSARVAAWLGRPRLAVAALCLSLGVANGPFLPEAFLARYPFLVSYIQGYVDDAIRLNRLCTPQATVGVFGAGAVPYYSGLHAIDFYGKTNRRVALRSPDLALPIGHNKTDLAYSIGELKPDFVEGFFWGRDDMRSAMPEYEKVDGLWLRRGSPRVRWDLVRGGR